MKKFIILSVLIASLTGCAGFSTLRYSASADNIIYLRTLNLKKIDIGQFTATQPDQTVIKCRQTAGIRLPDGGTFSEFIRKALISELVIANIYSETSLFKLTGNLDNLDVDSISGTLSFGLTLRTSNNKVITLTEKYPFKTDFGAYEACTNAAHAIMPSVQDLVGKIIRSPEFIASAQTEKEVPEALPSAVSKKVIPQTYQPSKPSSEKPQQAVKLKLTISGEKIKVGIIEFQNLNEEAKRDNLGTIFSEMLTTSFVSSGAFRITEREQLQKVARELQLSQSGIIDITQAKQIGKMVGADAIVTGSVTKIGSDLRLDARIIDVQSGIILTAEKAEGNVDLKTIGLMAENIVENLVINYYNEKK